MKDPLKFSVVIANYNYARFLSRAIDSALQLRWPSIEVIVVDDGSADGSRAVIDQYGDGITAIFQANGGQRVANNAGFGASTGDVVIFLDADDVLEPDMASKVAAVWRDGVSKVQVQMQRVDVHERPTGSVIPRLDGSPSADQIRRWATSTMEYPTPPGSGNAYARAFLERIFPLDASRDSATDSTCIAMAPFLGDVATVLQPLVRYRMHGTNDSNLVANERNFGREVGRALLRLKAAQDACAMQGLAPPSSRTLRFGCHLLQLRAASMRLRPGEHPISGDNRRRALVDAFALPFRSGPEPLGRKLIFAAFSVLALLAPRPLARKLVLKRFAQTA